MTQPRKILDWALHAYVDGELEDADKKLVEKELASDPETRHLVESWQRQKKQIADAYASVLEEGMPGGIRAALVPPKVVLPLWSIAGAIALLLILAIGAYGLVSLLPSRNAERFAENALSAHIVYASENERPVEVSANERNYLDKWLTTRFGRPIVTPDLSSRGFAFVGGRLLHEDRRPAAQLMYEDRNKRRLTVYVTPNTTGSEIPFRLREDAHLVTCYWLDEDAAYAVVGELQPRDLLPLATFIYKKMEAPKPS
jgi:anti-sigma factor RsiW